MLRRLVPGIACLFSASGCVDSSARDDADGAVVIRGCAVDSPPPVAPGGYYTNGSSVCTADGALHLFHGVDRPSLEWGAGEHLGAADFQAMAAWHANVVRVELNQDFWLEGAALHMEGYDDTVDRVVHFAESVGMDVILDLHWSDRGDLGVTRLQGANQAGSSNQQPMADVNSLEFWTEVATRYRDDGHVMFELYNEPHGLSWTEWLNGSYLDYEVVGMQALYDAVRATGADNIVVAGGLSYAFDLSGVGATPIEGYNVIYATHPYHPQDPQSRWERAFGYLATGDIAPVMATEFGDSSSDCTGDWDRQLIEFADARRISWSAWAWYAGGCQFPSLISDWSYTTTVQGDAVKAALLAYPYAPTGLGDGGPSDGGASDGGPSDASATDSGLPDATDASGADAAPGAGTTDSGGPSDAGPDGGADAATP
jgi:endoglucanase